MNLFSNLTFLIIASIITVQAAVPTPDREEHLLTQMRSSDIVQVENGLVMIQNEVISSPKIIQALYKMLDDARPDRRLSQDVIGRSPGKHAYEALSKITGFEPSQPSLLFDEAKAELKAFVRVKYPDLFHEDQHSAQAETNSSQTDVALHEKSLIPADSTLSVNHPPPLTQQTSTIQTAAPLEQPGSAAPATPMVKANSAPFGFPIITLAIVVAVISGILIYLIRRK